MKRFPISFFSLLFFPAFLGASMSRAYNDVSVDIPLEGGGVLSYSRMWPLNRFVEAGLVAGGGVIHRDFNFSTPSQGEIEMKTKALMLPFIGPRLSLQFEFIGLSLGYGVFYAKTDIEAASSALGNLTGSKSGWGTGFYAPLLVLDFYNSKHDVLVGLGLGGFFGTSFPTLEANSSSERVTTDESPVTGLTLTLRARWLDGRPGRTKSGKELGDEF